MKDFKFNYKEFEEFFDSFISVFNGETITIRKARLENLKIRYQDFIDFFFSLHFVLKEKINLKTIFNNKELINFKEDFGNFLYLYNKDYKQLQEYLYSLPYKLQIILQIVLNNSLERRFQQDGLLLSIDKFYKMSDILLIVELPDILNLEDTYIQSVKRVYTKNELTFPLEYFKIPMKMNRKFIVYFIKDGDKVVSNIRQGRLRREIINNISYDFYGLIGTVVKIKGFKKKYKLIISYFNKGSKNVINLYKGVEDVYDNQLYLITLKNLEFLEKAKINLVKTKDDFVKIFKGLKQNKQYIIQNNKGVFTYKTNVLYDFAKIIDYIYNEDFEAIGLKVFYQEKYYDIYFNVMESDYLETIENRFVKIGVVKFNDIILKVVYNSDVKRWSNVSNYCLICENVKSKHCKNGICCNCVRKLYEFTSNLGANYEEKCSKEFKTYVNKFYIISEKGKLKFIPDNGKQLTFKFDDTKFCKEE